MYLDNREMEIGGLLICDILSLFTTVLANLDSARLPMNEKSFSSSFTYTFLDTGALRAL